MAVLSFNSGRFYSSHGQRIAAKQLPDGRVAFLDLDRNIDGITLDKVTLSQASVMYAYDQGRYSPGVCCTGSLGRAEEAEVCKELKDAAMAVRPLVAY